MVDAGDIAPDFTLPSTAGNITLSAVVADRRVVLAFYMEDRTPGCNADAECAARRIRNHPRTGRRSDSGKRRLP